MGCKVLTLTVRTSATPSCFQHSHSLLLLPNEQLHWNKWRISALLDGTITVIARGGNAIHSPSPSKYPADCQLSHHVSTQPTFSRRLALIRGLEGTIKLEKKYETPETPMHLLICCRHRRANEMLLFISSLVGAEWLQDRSLTARLSIDFQGIMTVVIQAGCWWLVTAL